MNTKTIHFLELAKKIENELIPTDVISEIASWKKVIKSPYGNSFYNEPVDWNYKAPNSFRIADHWNFISRGKKHCETTTPIADKQWAIGKYNSFLKKYEIIKEFSPTNTKIGYTMIFRLIVLDFKRREALRNLVNASVDKINKFEMSFLNKYFQVLETQ